MSLTELREHGLAWVLLWNKRGNAYILIFRNGAGSLQLKSFFSANYHNKIPFIYKNPYKYQLIDNQNTNKKIAELWFIICRDSR